MDKSKVKSILPKPSPATMTSPTVVLSGASTPVGGKRRLTKEFKPLKRQRQVSTPSVKNEESDYFLDDEKSDKHSKQAGHRPVTSCSFCRQHKIKCNASENYPLPCQRCERMGLKCEIDPQFRPKKGSQIQSLKSDVDELKAKIEMLSKNESLLTQALNQHNLNFLQQQQHQPSYHSYNSTPRQVSVTNTPTQFAMDNPSPFSATPQITHILKDNSDNSPYKSPVAEKIDCTPISEFVLGDVKLPLEKATQLHDSFMTKNLPFLPILVSSSASELYRKSQLLFWTIMVTAALSEPEPTLYMSLASLIKQLAIETCWIRTPRSTHVIQALIILSIWPLPNEKVLDDCSYRFIGLAKNLSLQLGLHRGGEFIQEFSRTQVSLGPDAEKWRTRSWLAVFFCEQFWSSVLGLPPSIGTTDYLLENARVDPSLPKDFRCLISLSIFQCKLVNVMGISVTRPDGLLEPLNRAGSLNILDRELDRLKFKLNIDDGSAVDVYFLYIKLMICCFAFLPGTPIEDQVKFVSSAYLSATRIITITSHMINSSMTLIELPIYVRQAITYSVLLLFKLHLSRYLIDNYVDSARQLIVTVHRLLRNTLSSWKDLKNDISRNAKVLENLNIVLYTYPDIFLNDDDQTTGSIITRMRSHLTASLFYDLVWCVHEARRRTLLDKNDPNSKPEISDENNRQLSTYSGSNTLNTRKPTPLPFYNQITKDDFQTISTTTPNGTTITTLVPTDEAMNQARLNANGHDKPLEINGIPLAMLEATGSIKDSMKNEANIDETSRRNQNSRGVYRLQNDLGESHLQQYVQPGIDTLNQPLYGTNSSMNLPLQPSITSPSIQGTPMQFIQTQGANGQYGGVADQLDNFFQQQSNGWLNNDNYQDDDFLGWFDVNMMPEK
jgi:hypothetical protein